MPKLTLRTTGAPPIGKPACPPAVCACRPSFTQNGELDVVGRVALSTALSVANRINAMFVRRRSPKLLSPRCYLHSFAVFIAVSASALVL